MSAAEAIYGRLNGATSAGSRIFPLTLPQDGALPAVTYQQVSRVEDATMKVRGPFARARMQVDCWGDTYAEARALAAEVDSLLARFKGTVGATEVLDVFPANEMEFFEPDVFARRVMLEYMMILRV